MSDSLKDEWVKRVLGVDPANGSAGPQVADAKELTARLSDLMVRAQAEGVLDTLRAELKTAGTAVKTAPDDAAKQLDALETKLGALIVEKRRKDAAAEIEKGAASGKVKVVAFAKMRLKLRDVESAVDLAGGNLQAACEAMLQTDLFDDDDLRDTPEVQAAIANIADQIPPFEECASAVQDALDAMMNATGDERTKLAAAALKPIGAYRQKLAAASFLAEMESSEAGNYAIVTPILAAVKDLETALAG